VLIGMEPSLGSWASENGQASARRAREMVDAGFRNFMFSFEDFLLHHAAREYLCREGQTYHLTDVSKGAMTVEMAGRNREDRYDRWFSLLEAELKLVTKPTSQVFAIGKAVEACLKDRGLLPTRALIHYSSQAARARRRFVEGREKEFEAFARKINLDQIEHTVSAVLEAAGVPEPMASGIRDRVLCKELSESRKMLLFSYWCTLSD
jgi:hypothetical protein